MQASSYQRMLMKQELLNSIHNDTMLFQQAQQEARWKKKGNQRAYYKLLWSSIQAPTK